LITEDDLRAAIAECQGERNPNANTGIKLAAFYTILNEMTGPVPQGYSGDGQASTIRIDSGSAFANAVNGRSPEEIWPIIDELAEALAVVNPRLYASFIRKLEGRE
jgi:hypothetical protein